MTALFVTVGIIIFIIILMSIPLNFSISFHEKLNLKIRYLIFSYKLNSTKSLTKKKENSKENNITKKDKDSKTNKIIKNFKILSEIFFDSVKFLISKINIKKMNIFVSLSKNEASETAIEYGKICSIICPIINLVLENTKPKEYNVKIFPDFNKTKTSIDADFKFNISLINIFKCLANLIFEIILNYKKIKAKKGVKI